MDSQTTELFGNEYSVGLTLIFTVGKGMIGEGGETWILLERLFELGVGGTGLTWMVIHRGTSFMCLLYEKSGGCPFLTWLPACGMLSREACLAPSLHIFRRQVKTFLFS